MRFILHALSALSEALTPLKHTGPWETLFPILLLESVVNFSEEFDHNSLFHAPRYLLFAHHSSNSQTGQNRGRAEVVPSLSAAQCGLFTKKSVPVIFEPPCTYVLNTPSPTSGLRYAKLRFWTSTGSRHWTRTHITLQTISAISHYLCDRASGCPNIHLGCSHHEMNLPNRNNRRVSSTSPILSLQQP